MAPTSLTSVKSSCHGWQTLQLQAPVTATQPEASKDVNMDEPQDQGNQRPQQAAEMDYDVADDDDNWLVD
jgi:hypothetical protein